MRQRENLKDGATRSITPDERKRRTQREKQEIANITLTEEGREKLRAKWRDERKRRIENMTDEERAAYREKNRAYQREYYARNSEAAKARAAKRRIEKPEAVAREGAAYRAAHKAERAAYDRARRLADPEAKLEQQRAYRQRKRQEKQTDSSE